MLLPVRLATVTAHSRAIWMLNFMITEKEHLKQYYYIYHIFFIISFSLNIYLNLINNQYVIPIEAKNICKYVIP